MDKWMLSRKRGPVYVSCWTCMTRGVGYFIAANTGWARGGERGVGLYVFGKQGIRDGLPDEDNKKKKK